MEGRGGREGGIRKERDGEVSSNRARDAQCTPEPRRSPLKRPVGSGERCAAFC